MSVTDPAPVFLAELVVYDPFLPGNRTLRYSSHIGFVTGPAETPANTYYDARIQEPARMTRDAFSSGRTQGESRVGFGDLILKNDDGVLDPLLQYAFDGWPITIRMGQIGAAYPAGFQTFLVATMQQPEFDGALVRVKLRDRQDELGIPLQTKKYGGTNLLPDGVDGSVTDLKGKPKPVCCGVVKNVPAPCVNPSKNIFQVSDTQVASIDAVYDRGVSIGQRLIIAGGDASVSGAFSNSREGRTWVQHAGLFGGSAINGIACFAGLVIMVGANNNIWTTPDGDTWTQQASPFPAGTNLKCIAAGPGLCVIGGQEGCFATSVDGLTWVATVARTTGLFGFTDVDCLGFGNGAFVAGGISKLAYSVDGAGWAARNAAGLTIRFIVYGERWIAGSSGAVLYSTDGGTTWLSGGTPTFATFGLAYGNGIYLHAGGTGGTATSLDGITITPQVNPFGTNQVNTVTFSPTLARFYAGTFGGAAAQLASTPDGKVWDLLTHNLGGNINVVYAAEALNPATYSSVADLLDDTKAPLAGSFKVYLGGGYFRLGVAPAGLITADVTEGATAADRTTAQIFKRVLQRMGKTSVDYSAADIAALDVANSAVLGFWTAQEITAAAVLDLIAGSVGAWWGVDRTGVYRIQQFTAPTGNPVASFNANDLQRPPTRVPVDDAGAGIPLWRQVVRYQRVYAVQTSDGLAGQVTQARRNIVGLEWREAVQSDPTVLTSHLLAQQAADDSLLSTEADAQAEAVRRLILRSVRRDRFEVLIELNATTVLVDLGNVVQLTHPRFGLGSGQLFRVISIEPNGTDRTILLTLWGSVDSGAVPPNPFAGVSRGSMDNRHGPRFRRPHERKAL